MKNEEIIAAAAVKEGIITAAEAKRMLDEKIEIPLHTLQGWNLRGKLRIKFGEKPIEVKLWKKKDGKNGFYLARANLYSRNQMEEY